MAYEVTYVFHPRKEEGGYDTEKLEEKTISIGKAFEETPLEKLAAGIMLQLARRDVWVIDVKVLELIKKEVSFKESKDGKGIVLKNKRFSLNGSSELVAENLTSEELQVLPPGVQPHEVLLPSRLAQSADDLYSNPNKSLVKKRTDPRNIDKHRVLYWVYFEPELIYQTEARNLKLKFTEDRKYPVHAVIPSATGKLDAQQLAVSDDTGQVVIIDEKFFTSAGQGLLGDKELGFSGNSQKGIKKSKLSFEDQLTIDNSIPIDDGAIPKDLWQVPDIRARKL